MGGTFDRLHRGHRRLLRVAAELPAEHLFVGVTSDDLASRGRSRAVRPLAERLEAVRRFVVENGLGHVEVAEIRDAVGPAMDPAFTHIVVTPETRGRALDISGDRERAGVAPLEVVVVPFVLADDGRPVRATRVAAGEVDAEGRLLRAPVVAVGSDNPVKVDATRAVFARFFKDPVVKARKVATRVPEQPKGAETWAGALARARAARGSVAGADFGVGIEAGLFRAGPDDAWLDVQVCVVVDAADRATHGQGPGFTHPPRVLDDVLERGMSIGGSVAALSNDPEVGRKGGAIGWLTAGRLGRAELTESAVLMALLPRANPDLYGL